MTEHRKQYLREYRKRYVQEHPERLKQWELNRAIALLTRNGYTIIAPDPARREDKK